MYNSLDSIFTQCLFVQALTHPLHNVGVSAVIAANKFYSAQPSIPPDRSKPDSSDKSKPDTSDRSKPERASAKSKPDVSGKSKPDVSAKSKPDVSTKSKSDTSDRSEPDAPDSRHIITKHVMNSVQLTNAQHSSCSNNPISDNNTQTNGEFLHH